MFDVAPTELMLVAVVALLVIGPKDLPKAMRFVGHWVGKARGVARQFRSGFDTMVREAELQEMEKKWATENERIMREHPQPNHMLATTATDAVVDDTLVDHVAGDAPPAMTAQPAIVAAPPEPALPAEPAAPTESGEGAPPPVKKPRKRTKAAS